MMLTILSIFLIFGDHYFWKVSSYVSDRRYAYDNAKTGVWPAL